jgi:hypothetical protein
VYLNTPEEALALVGFLDRSGTVVFEEMLDQAPSALPDNRRTVPRLLREYWAASRSGADLWLDNLQRLGLVAVEKHTEANLVPEDEDHTTPTSTMFHIATSFSLRLARHYCMRAPS